MDYHTPPPNEIINTKPPSIKKIHKQAKMKKNYTIPLVTSRKNKLNCNVNSKNQKKRKEKQLARQLFKITKKIGTIL
jgi:hypothetical protein